MDAETIRNDVEAAADYLRSKWGEFVDMGPRLIDAQHRAAVAAARARQRGDAERYEQARDVIRRLGELNVLHGKALDKMRSVAGVLGLSGYAGLGAIPVAYVAAVTGLALIVIYFFRAFAAESRILDMIEAGTLTPAQAAEIRASTGASPGAVFGQVTGLAKLALFAAIGFGLYRIVETFGPGFARNPPLVIFDRNPPDAADGEVFGEEVYAIWYRHADDGANYVHDFGPGVELIARPDGSAGLSHRRGRRVWEEF